MDACRHLGEFRHAQRKNHHHREWPRPGENVRRPGNAREQAGEVVRPGHAGPVQRPQARGSNAVALAQAVASGLGGISWELVEPLFDELLGCVYRVPDPSTPAARVQLNPANVDAHIQDMGTLLRLRAGVLEVCFDFFGRDGGLYSRLTTAADRLTSGTTKPSRPA